MTLLALSSLLLVPVVVLAPPAHAATGPLVYRPFSPTRLFDTRLTEPIAGPKGRIPANGQIDVQVSGAVGIPANAQAVVLNLTATNATAAGFVTAWPSGRSRPLASNLNINRANETVANLVITAVGSNGFISLYTSGGTDLLADVTGYFQPRGSLNGPCLGVVSTFGPFRVIDTRPSSPDPSPKGLVSPGGEVGAQITGLSVPGTAAVIPTSATAAIVTVTGTDASGPGWLTAWPSLTARPLASTVNLDGPGHTAANLAIVPIGADGQIRVYSSAGAHVIVDVMGFFADDNRTSTTERICADRPVIIVPDAPFRILDTRPTEPPPPPLGGSKGVLDPGATAYYFYDPMVATTAGTFLNVTMANANPGFVTAWRGDTQRPRTSALNISRAGDTRAGAAFLNDGGTPTVPRGIGAIYTSGGGHLLLDVMAIATVVG